jgi:hypothetical protein
MMTVADAALYQRHRWARDREGPWSLHAFWLPMLLFGSMGAITWAIRGTDGWGGIDGTLVPGLTWGLLWYYLCRRRGIDARGMVLWLGMGIAIGGELGYGQYVSWIQGNFHIGDDVVPVSPWAGYAWFVICGIGWGAPGGIVLGWALNSQVPTKVWLIRALLLVTLLVVIFNLGTSLLGSGVVELVGTWIARHCPWLIFPNAGMGIYAGELDGHLGRTVYTNTQNFLVLVWWLLAMAVAALQRDRATLVAGAVIGGGFGIGFALSALWCIGYAHAPGYIDWWKMWELHAGLNLGLLYVIVFNWATRHLDAAHAPDGTRATPEPPRPASQGVISGFLAVSGFVLIFGAGYEYFFWTGVFLALFYALTVALAHRALPRGHTANDLSQRRRSMALVYSAFLLVFMLLHGVTSMLGVMLELYSHEAVGQYDWPKGRIGLMLAGASVLLMATLASIQTMLHHPRIAPYPSVGATRLPGRMVDLFTGIGIVGAVSIWPSKIGALYAIFLCLALFAFNRINRRMDEIDVRGP